MFSGIQTKIILAQVALLLLVFAGGYWYWSWSQNRISTLVAQTTQLQSAVNTQQQTIQTLEQHARQTAERMNQLQTDLAGADTRRRELENRIRRMNLQALGRSDAADLERRINEQTQQVFTDLENMTVPGGRTPQTPRGTNTPAPRPPVRESR